MLSPLLKRQVRLGAPRSSKPGSLGGVTGTSTTVTEPPDDLAQLAVALYLAYELVHEIKVHGEHDHPG